MWSKNAWKLSKNIIEQIEQCEFVKELANGKLPFDKFIFYIEQDNIYLQNFSERLEILHSQIEDETTKSYIRQNIDETLALEKGLHTYIQESFNTTFNDNTPLSPANIKYKKETEKVKNTDNPAITYASLLPCFWVYAHIGKLIYDNISKNNPFSSWINTYGDESFISEAETFRAICDEHAKNCTAEIINEMNQTFIRFTELELNFWNDSYNKKYI